MDSENANFIVVVVVPVDVVAGTSNANIPLLALSLPNHLPVLLQEQPVAPP
jgi:hypothetical protein